MTTPPAPLATGHALLEATQPARWLLLAAFGGLILSAFVAAVCCEMTLTSHGPGKLRAEVGPRSIVSEVGGAVEQLLVAPGQCVKRGEPLIQVASAALRSDLLQVDRRLELARERLRYVETEGTLSFQRRSEQLQEKQRLLERLGHNQQASTSAAQTNARDATLLLREGLLGRAESSARFEQLRASERELLRLAEQAAETQIQRQELAAQQDEELRRAREALHEGEAARAALTFALDNTTLRASQDGCVDVLLIRVGDVIAAGAVVARLVPAHAPRVLVAFLPERDRASVSEGDEVRVELAQLPAAEFGTLRGRVERIAFEIATASEVSEGLGEQLQIAEPSYRVAIAVLDSPERAELHSRLRSGMLVDVRYQLRRQRIISFLFAPLKRLFV